MTKNNNAKSNGVDFIKKMEKFARKYGEDTSKWVMGDKLYEEEFSKKYKWLITDLKKLKGIKQMPL